MINAVVGGASVTVLHSPRADQTCFGKTDLLIFSDLDGSLLDSEGQLPECNRLMLRQLESKSVPVVFTSSKTRLEILHLQQRLGMEQAFIPENGGGIYVPEGHALTQRVTLMPWADGYGLHFGVAYSYVRAVFMHLRSEHKICGMADMGIQTIMDLTGLDHQSVHRALAREFSEPFIFQGRPRLQELRESVSRFGLAITCGGRFFHMMSAMQDKGHAVSKAIQLFRLAHHKPPITIALGDAENDFTMLQVVDRPVLLRREDGSFADLDLPHLHRAQRSGCQGWSEQLALLIPELASAGSCQVAPEDS